MSEQNVGVRAQPRQKMIALTVYFWTNDIASGEDNILPKHCHSAGMVMVRANRSHGIPSSDRRYPFETLMELPQVVEESLAGAGIEMHVSPKMRRLIKHIE